jgi:transcriptional regulator with XRE-family HTH domain
MGSGKVIRELREHRFVKSTDVERTSRLIANAKGNTDFYVSHSTLADIENGSVPSIHKLFSLAVCLQVPLEELLLVFDIDANESVEFAGSVESGSRAPALNESGLRESRSRPQAAESLEPGFRFQLNFDAAFSSDETSLLMMSPREVASLPPSMLSTVEPRRYRYAVVGLNDDTMGELIPPGSVVEVDITQNTVQVCEWKTMRERPVYLVWHTEGHSCSWCHLEGKDLTLLPYPLSRQSVRRFKVPREASVIGRVVNAWVSFDQLSAGLDKGTLRIPAPRTAPVRIPKPGLPS